MTELQPEISIIHPKKIRPIPSATIELAQKARILKAEGRDVIELAGGDPDFLPDTHVTEAISYALNNGETKYTHPRGIPELRKAIANKHKRENGITADPDKEIIVTVGGKQAIAVTLMALLENREEVLIPGPSWVSYDCMTLIATGTPQTVPASPSNKFKITPDDLEKYSTSKTKAVIFNNPQNPTGQVYSKEEIYKICEWCQSRGVYLISDEVYEHIIFDNLTHCSPASSNRFKEFIITINAVSKTYVMTGLRLGWLHADESIIKKIDPYHQHLITCASSIIQWGAVAALDGPPDGILKRRKAYSSRRDLVVKLLSRSKFIKPLNPQGTFYLFMDVTETGLSSQEFCSKLLDEGSLALCPGSAFSHAGEGWVRMLFARDDITLTKACNRILKVFG